MEPNRVRDEYGAIIEALQDAVSDFLRRREKQLGGKRNRSRSRSLSRSRSRSRGRAIFDYFTGNRPRSRSDGRERVACELEDDMLANAVDASICEIRSRAADCEAVLQDRFRRGDDIAFKEFAEIAEFLSDGLDPLFGWRKSRALPNNSHEKLTILCQEVANSTIDVIENLQERLLNAEGLSAGPSPKDELPASASQRSQHQSQHSRLRTRSSSSYFSGTQDNIDLASRFDSQLHLNSQSHRGRRSTPRFQDTPRCSIHGRERSPDQHFGAGSISSTVHSTTTSQRTASSVFSHVSPSSSTSSSVTTPRSTSTFDWRSVPRHPSGQSSQGLRNKAAGTFATVKQHTPQISLSKSGVRIESRSQLNLAPSPPSQSERLTAEQPGRPPSRAESVAPSVVSSVFEPRPIRDEDAPRRRRRPRRVPVNREASSHHSNQDLVDMISRSDSTSSRAPTLPAYSKSPPSIIDYQAYAPQKGPHRTRYSYPGQRHDAIRSPPPRPPKSKTFDSQPYPVQQPPVPRPPSPDYSPREFIPIPEPVRTRRPTHHQSAPPNHHYADLYNRYRPPPTPPSVPWPQYSRTQLSPQATTGQWEPPI